VGRSLPAWSASTIKATTKNATTKNATTKNATTTTRKSTTVKSTTVKPTATTVKPAATTSAPTSGSAGGAAAKGEYVVSYAYTPSGGFGRVHNPYQAVWIETAEGAAVRTLFLSFESGRGLRWLPELVRWYRADQVRQMTGGTDVIAAVSSATRTPGSVRVAWDGLDDTRQPVAPGTYYVCIETAREKGPYSLVREAVKVGSSGFDQALPDNAEITGARITHAA
jgi:hypothetical protein